MSAPGDDVQIEGVGQPLALILGGIILGGIALFGDFFSGSTSYLRWVFLALGGVFILYPLFGAYARYRESGLVEAADWMMEAGEGSTGNQSRTKSAEKVPPPTETKKNELYFDRANQKCEWCGDHVDSPDVHHIVPRSEGGPNDLENLIVLCPSCHRRADNGAISQSKLQAKVRRQMQGWEA